VDQRAIDHCQEILCYRFADVELLSLALTHASVAPNRAASNERLEFLGDSVLSLVVCQELYQRDEELLEGDMTKIKSAVVSGQTCAKIADELGISQLVSLGKGLAERAGPPSSITAAVLEAIIGAIYLDGGLEAARKFVLANICPHLDQAMGNKHQHNYKSLLQQHSQRQWAKTPSYRLLDEKGPDHNKCFEVTVMIDGVNFPSAWGRTKKEAEQEAARQALIKLGVVPATEPGKPRPANGK